MVEKTMSILKYPMQQFNLNGLYLNDNNSSTYIKNIQLTKREELSSHQYDIITNKKKIKSYSIIKNDCHKSDCLNINIIHTASGGTEDLGHSFSQYGPPSR